MVSPPEHPRVRHPHQPGPLERICRCDPCQPAVHDAQGRHTSAQPFFDKATVVKCCSWTTLPRPSTGGRGGVSCPKVLSSEPERLQGPAEDARGRPPWSRSSRCRRACSSPIPGVKTSILILDKSLAKKADAIAFFKVENDGFGLGAQRREIEKNDLPETARLLREWMDHGIHGTHGKTEKDLSGSPSVYSVSSVVGNGLLVPKERIAANGDYNLSGERYRENGAALTAFPFRTIRDIAVEIRAGFASGQSSVDTVGVPHVRPMNISQDGKFVPEGMKCISRGGVQGP